jgi:glycosyltransferase involved in cell wall biosynthesis
MVIPLGIPARFYQFRWCGVLEMAVAFYYAIILSLVVTKDAIIIARNYNSGLAVFILKKFKSVKLIFDPRSQYIQENLGCNKLIEDSCEEKFWQMMEDKILSASDKIIVVSKAHAEYYKNRLQDLRLEVVPCFGQPEYSFINEARITKSRKIMGFSSSDLVICYYGSLDNKWNNMEMYKRFFYQCIDSGYKLCILSQNADKVISDSRIASSGAFIKNVEAPEEAKELMSACDFGVMILKKSKTWESIVGVKFVEYLCCGLQVILGEYVGGAVRIAKEHFPDHSLVVTGTGESFNTISLNQANIQSKLEIAHKAGDLFGYHNMKRIVGFSEE